MRVRKAVLKALKHSDRPVTFDEIVAGPGAGVSQAQLRDTLRHLVKTGHVLETKDGAYMPLRERHQSTGRLGVNPRGYGFVATPAGDIYIAARDMHGAMHNDTVAVRVFLRSNGLGHAGEVTEIIERANDRIVGRFEKQGRMGLVTPTDRRIHGDVIVDRSGFMEAKTGDIVVVRITRFPGQGQAAQGVVEEVLGLETDPGVDVEIVIREHGLRTAFPDEVEAAAARDPRDGGSAREGACRPARPAHRHDRSRGRSRLRRRHLAAAA